MNSLRMLCSTGMDWLAHSIPRLPISASSMLLMSNEVLLATDVAIFSCLRILVGMTLFLSPCSTAALGCGGLRHRRGTPAPQETGLNLLTSRAHLAVCRG